jgi:NADH-quinone oxidoreductase subunit E
MGVLKDRIDEIAARYAQRRSAIMPALHLIQAEQGYISRHSMEEVANILDIAPVQVYEVASFYHQFHTEPIGTYHLQVCTNVSCMLMGAECLVNRLEHSLNIVCGETTADNRITLSIVQCLGSCDTAPVMQINNEAYSENLTEQKLDDILRSLND